MEGEDCMTSQRTGTSIFTYFIRRSRAGSSKYYQLLFSDILEDNHVTTDKYFLDD
jgi:hypothetical protein